MSKYKAKAVGILVKQVGSAYTSQRCAECGFCRSLIFSECLDYLSLDSEGIPS